MPKLLDIATFIIGKDLRINSKNEQFVKALLTDSKQNIITPSESLTSFIKTSKTIKTKTSLGNFYDSEPLAQPIRLYEYGKFEKTPIQAKGIISGKLGDCYIHSSKLGEGTWNKTIKVKVGDDYEQACRGWGHFYDRHGFRCDPNPVHPIERTLGIDKFRIKL